MNIHIPHACWRASVVRMEAATVRVDLLLSSPPAPRYALVPTPSKIEESATNDATSVSGKLYVHGWTAALPRAAVSSSTCECSCAAISSNLPRVNAGKPASVNAFSSYLARPVE